MSLDCLDKLMTAVPEPAEKPDLPPCEDCRALCEASWVQYGGGYWLPYFDGVRGVREGLCAKCGDMRIQAKRKKRLSDQRRQQYRAWVDSIPPVIRRNDPKLDDLPEGVRNSLRSWVAGDDDDWCLTLHGPSGSGKTHAAYAAARQWYYNACIDPEANASEPSFWVLHELLEVARQESRQDEPGSIERLRTDERLVIVDELTSERVTEFALETVYALIYRRHLHQLPTIITTNLDLSEIAAAYSDRISSRLSDGLVVGMHGKDRRLKTRPTEIATTDPTTNKETNQ